MGCTPVVSHSSGGGGGGFWGSVWGFAKKAAGFVYHASGAADVVGCVSHPSWGGCLKAAGAVALTVMTSGAGEVLARAALETTAGLVARSLAARVALRVAESPLGAAGRYLRAGASAFRDTLNPVRYVQVGERPLMYIPNEAGGRMLSMPEYSAVRLYGDHPIRSAVEGMRSFYDNMGAEGQDTLPELPQRAIEAIRHMKGL